METAILELIKGFSQYGIGGLFAGLLIWEIVFLQSKMMKLVERNTESNQGLREAILNMSKTIERCEK